MVVQILILTHELAGQNGINYDGLKIYKRVNALLLGLLGGDLR